MDTGREGHLPTGIDCRDRQGATAPWQPVCSSTRESIGWLDSDHDGIPDILDVDPVITMNAFGGLPAPQALTYSGTAKSPALPNANPYGDGAPAGPMGEASIVLHNSATSYTWTRNNITINTITSVEYRVKNEGAVVQDWSSAIPVVGAFDADSESFRFTTPALGNGTNIIEARCTNSMGVKSMSVADTVEVTAINVLAWGHVKMQMNFKAEFNPLSPSILLKLIVPCKQRVSIKVYSLSGGLVSVLANGELEAGLNTICWNTANEGTGIYIAKLQLGGKGYTEKLMITK